MPRAKAIYNGPIDRGPDNTGYHERSRVHYTGDQKKATHRIDEWLNNRGEWDKRPLFREVRDGHIAALQSRRVLDRYRAGPDDFLLTVDKQREEWRRRYYKDTEGSIRRRDRRTREAEVEGVTIRRLDIAVFEAVCAGEDMCFGCASPLGENSLTAPNDRRIRVHATVECQQLAEQRLARLKGEGGKG